MVQDNIGLSHDKNAVVLVSLDVVSVYPSSLSGHASQDYDNVASSSLIRSTLSTSCQSKGKAESAAG